MEHGAWSMAILHGARCKVQQLHVLGRGTISPGPALHVHKQERAGGAPPPPKQVRTARRMSELHVGSVPGNGSSTRKGGGGGKQLRHSSQH